MDFQDKKNLSENEQSIQTRVFKALSEAKEKLKAFESQQSEPLAIVGLGCRFGHNIATPESFWSFLKAGKNNLREIPRSAGTSRIFMIQIGIKWVKSMFLRGGFSMMSPSLMPIFSELLPRKPSLWILSKGCF